MSAGAASRAVRRPPLADAASIAAAALIAYALLGQSRFYAYDAETFYMLVARGQLEHFAHPLYLPINAAVATALEPFGISLFRAMTLASALGVAVFVGFAHRAAAVLGLGRRSALAVAVLCATAPSNLFFATVIEVHGVFLAFAGGAFLAAAHAARSPRLPRALVLGLSTGLAATAHASGHLLPIAAGLLLLAEAPRLRRPKTLLAWSLVGAAGHAAARVGIGTVAGAGDLAQTTSYVATQLEHAAVARLPWTVWYEWLLPFAPLGWIAIAGLLFARVRPTALALHVALVPYLGLAALMLRGWMIENGAYLQPLSFVAALVVARLVPFRAALACALLGGMLGVAGVMQHDRGTPGTVRADDVLAMRGDAEAVFVMDGEAEARAVLLAAPGLPVVRVEILTGSLLADGAATAFQRFDAAFAAITGGGSGTVYLSERARAALGRYDPRLARHLAEAYEFVPRQSGEFRAFELRRRR